MTVRSLVVVVAVGLACGDDGARESQAVAVTISPDSLTAEVRALARFEATVTGGSDHRVAWSADAGAVEEDGTWTAPAVPGTYRITAQSVADPTKAATAWATVVLPHVDTPPVQEPVSVTIIPEEADLVAGVPFRFEARVTGADDTRVAWSVEDPVGRVAIQADGTFLAPNGDWTYRVVATSVADPTKSAIAVVRVWNDLVDHGGPVLPASRTFALFWGDPAEFEPDLVPAIERFLGNLDGTPYLAVTDQYMRGARTTTRFAGSFFDPSAPPIYPAFVIEEAACQVLVDHGIAPEWGDFVFVYTSNFPEQATPWCASHGYITCNGQPVIVGYVPNPTRSEFCSYYAGDACGSGYSFGAVDRVASTAHEFIEGITDPYGDAWHVSGREAVDRCGMLECVPFAGGPIELQTFYSNAVHGCAVE